VALNTNRLSQAEKLLSQALTAVTPRRHVWWQPAAYHAWGRLLLAQAEVESPHRKTAVAEAYQFFHKGLRAVESGGCPDELPLILLQLGLTARELGEAQCWHYLETAVQIAQQRARFTDRQLVLKQAGDLLLQAPAAHLQRHGQNVVTHTAAAP
jgi:hypothetical protein